MRRIIAIVAFLLASLTPALVFAQGFNPAGAPPWVYADNYGRWAFQGQAPNTYTFSNVSGCQVTQLNFSNKPTFYAFGDTVALAPVLIADVNSAESEVVTPGSYLTPTQESCGPALSPANSHTTFTLQSGTGGLQEALNVTSGPVILSGEWYKLISGIASLNATLTSAVTPANVIGSATCASTSQVIDVTTNPWTYYGCNASHALVVTNLASKAPTIVAGAGAGGSGVTTVVTGSNASTGTVRVTTAGTAPTASGIIFTLTFPSSTVGGYPYAPACTYTSVGATAYAGAVATATAGPPATSILTATATALTNSIATYAWTYSCH